MMSLLRKLSHCEDFFRDKVNKGDAATESTGDVFVERMPGVLNARPLTRNEVEEWAVEKSTEMTMLRDWLRKQPHLPQNVTDEQILVFLHSCRDSVEMTKIKIDNHFTMRTHAPEIFTRRSLSSKEVKQALRVARISPLRHATPDGRNVIFVDCVDPNVENYNFTDVLKATGMAVDALVRYHPREEGNMIVFDMRNSAAAHILRTNSSTLKKAMLFVQTSLPFRLTEIHVINASPLIHQIQTILRPFLDSELRKLIHIHMQDNMESFYKIIPKKYLPVDYGGEAASLKELNDVLNQMILEQEAYLEAVEKQVVNEYKRSGRTKTKGDTFGAEGSFRRLECD